MLLLLPAFALHNIPCCFLSLRLLKEPRIFLSRTFTLVIFSPPICSVPLQSSLEAWVLCAALNSYFTSEGLAKSSPPQPTFIIIPTVNLFFQGFCKHFYHKPYHFPPGVLLGSSILSFKPLFPFSILQVVSFFCHFTHFHYFLSFPFPSLLIFQVLLTFKALYRSHLSLSFSILPLTLFIFCKLNLLENPPEPYFISYLHSYSLAGPADLELLNIG